MRVTFNCITKPSSEMTPEEYIIYCGRVSNSENRLNHETAPKLLSYLVKNKHWSPFEMISLGFEIETSRAIAQQLLRHRSFSFQEFSQRYSKVEAIEPVELRMQADKNRQSSKLINSDEHTATEVADYILLGKKLYNNLINNGVAKECARFILPLTTQTTIIMHGTLRSWIHFLDQRCDNHAQKEIRLVAEEIKKHITKKCPWTMKALELIDNE